MLSLKIIFRPAFDPYKVWTKITAILRIKGNPGASAIAGSNEIDKSIVYASLFK